MTHFTDIELQRWRTANASGERDRIVAHVAECADCASRYAAAIRDRRLRDAEPAAGDLRDFVAAGHAAVKRRTWIVPAAIAAAAIIAIVFVPLAMRRDERPGDLHFRGAGVQALAPQGPVERANAQFVWASGVAASRYRIEVGRGNRVVYRTESVATRLPVPAQLEAGATYWWTVTAIDAQGRPIGSSARRSFTIVR